MNSHAAVEAAGSGIRWPAVGMAILGLALMLVLHWQVFFWVNTEATMGVVQRIFYIHVPAAWVGIYLAFGIVALCSGLYLWLEDERFRHGGCGCSRGWYGIHHDRPADGSALGEDRLGHLLDVGPAAHLDPASMVHLSRILHRTRLD